MSTHSCSVSWKPHSVPVAHAYVLHFHRTFSHRVSPPVRIAITVQQQPTPITARECPSGSIHSDVAGMHPAPSHNIGSRTFPRRLQASDEAACEPGGLSGDDLFYFYMYMYVCMAELCIHSELLSSEPVQHVSWRPG